MVGARIGAHNSVRRRRQPGNYITNKYYKDPVERKKFGPIVPKTLKHKDNCPPPRARYFKSFRTERNWMKEIENCYPRDLSRSQYRAIRYLYYVVLRYLNISLWFEPDRVRLRDIEHDFYNWLLSYNYSKERRSVPSRVHIWLFRPNMTHEVGQ